MCVWVKQEPHAAKRLIYFLYKIQVSHCKKWTFMEFFFFLLLSFGLSGMSVIVSSGELLYVLICNWKNDLKYKMITI